MPVTSRLARHPRLLIGPEQISRLSRTPDTPLLKAAADEVSWLAGQYVDSPRFDWELNTHNAHLIRARKMQGRVMTLIVQWLAGGDDRFRRAAIEHVAEMDRWKFWSWGAWRKGDDDPNASFDLSYGENSATLALSYDLLYDSLSDSQRRMFVDIARRRALGPCAKLNDGRDRCWWWRAYQSNWLTVCGGGAGMLCLAMYEDIPEAPRLLPRLDRQLLGYMRTAEQCGGGWPEGVGYWNYGMRYGYMYWLSHERATGRPHKALAAPAARRTLWFPADFSPNDVGTGFGDIPVPWRPEPFHYAAAERFADAPLLRTIDSVVARQGVIGAPAGPGPRANGSGSSGSPAVRTYAGRSGQWPWAAEFLLFRPRSTESPERNPARRPGLAVHLYPSMEWGYLADQMPDPKIYLSLRGGSTRTPHAHLDVLSFVCVFGDEAVLRPIAPRQYLDTTFSDRQFEMFEKGWAGKNTIVIGGVGLSHPAMAQAEPVRHADAVGYRLNAPEAIRINYQEQQVRGLSRTILMLGQRAFLVLDRITLAGTNHIEARFCTPMAVHINKHSAMLHGRQQRAAMSFAANADCRLMTTGTLATDPQAEPHSLIRWCTEGLEQDVLLAMLIVPGGRAGRVAVKRTARRFAVEVAFSGRAFEYHLR